MTEQALQAIDVRRWLLARAESYSSDAMTLRHMGLTDDALVYEAIRDELRKCAEGVPQ